MRDVAKLQVPRKRGRKREKARVASSDLASNSAEPVSALPVAPALKTKPTQRCAEFARMTIAAPTTP